MIRYIDSSLEKSTTEVYIIFMIMKLIHVSHDTWLGHVN